MRSGMRRNQRLKEKGVDLLAVVMTIEGPHEEERVNDSSFLHVLSRSDSFESLSPPLRRLFTVLLSQQIQLFHLGLVRPVGWGISGSNLNFCPPTEAETISPAFGRVKTATPCL